VAVDEVTQEQQQVVAALAQRRQVDLETSRR
jgi:hypothetical protein